MTTGVWRLNAPIQVSLFVRAWAEFSTYVEQDDQYAEFFTTLADHIRESNSDYMSWLQRFFDQCPLEMRAEALASIFSWIGRYPTSYPDQDPNLFLPRLGRWLQNSFCNRDVIVPMSNRNADVGALVLDDSVGCGGGRG